VNTNRTWVVLLTIAFAFLSGIPSSRADGIVYLEGTDDRGENSLPVVEGSDQGEFTVDIYAEDLPGFAGFELLLTLPSPVFQVAYNHTPPNVDEPFGDRKIVVNTTFLPKVESRCEGQTVGLLSTEREWIDIPVYDWGDYLDKSIPAADDIDFRTGLPYGRTWLMSVTYTYSADADPGTYTVEADGSATAFHDRNENPLPFTVVAGSLTIAEYIPDTTPPSPSPATWATQPYATTLTSITMTSTAATDASAVEYYFQETSGNPGGDNRDWSPRREYTDTGLTPEMTYTYRVKARDQSDNHNETEYSVPRSATVEGPFSGKLIIEGPRELSEGRLPPAIVQASEFTVHIYAENFPAFAGFEITMSFLDALLVPRSGFSVAYHNDPPDPGADWGDRKITHNTQFLPEIESRCQGETVGLLSVEREWIEHPIYDWGDFVDKSIPAAGDIDPATSDPYERTWLMSVTYSFNQGAPSGMCTIDAYSGTTRFYDRDDNDLAFTVLTGGLTIGWYIEGDVNGDCSVNILDMISVRNRLNHDVDSGDNWKADITGDGSINILDLIAVRNKSYTRCPDP